ncbi:MAG: MFS transporter [Lentisphaerae bacterium]|nr:MFS transporter [Lentisphaerota bacterium]
MPAEAPAPSAATGEPPTRRSPALLRIFAAIASAIGIAGLAATAFVAHRCFAVDPDVDLIARLTRDHATVRLWLLILLPLATVTFAVFAVAGWGLFRARRWALNLAIGQAITGLAGVLLGAIIVFSHFGETLKTPTGFTRADFPVTLSHAAKHDVSVRFETHGGLAWPGTDFIATNGTLTIPAGTMNATIAVNVVGDPSPEPATEAFSLNLTNAVGAPLAQATAIGTIRDDDGPPSITLADATVRERNYGHIDAVFVLELSHPVDHPVSVDFATADVTATEGADYLRTNGTISIPAWQRKADIVVPVLGDIVAETPVESFTVALSNPRNAVLSDAAVATGRILDNEGTPLVTVADAVVTETDRDTVQAAFLVTVSRPYPDFIDLTYATTNLTARSPKDYTETSGKIRFRPRLTNIVVNVDVQPDYLPEGTAETFGFHLQMVDGATLVDSNAVGTIVDDDSPPLLSVGSVTVVEGNPADDPVVAALAEMRRVGTWFGVILLLVAPLGALVLGSRKPVLNAVGIDPESPTFTAGTLVYTKLGLTALFAWLLWGEFCWTIMEAVVPSVLPFKLKALGASNTLMVVILNTLPSILNLTICPWVSFKSDRYRSRWGRRIPFILWTMPFLTISLILLGASEPIAAWIRDVVPAAQTVAPNTMAIIVIAVLMVTFQFFNMFVNSVFWYLFNDVVPPQFLGRFMGLFRLVGTAAGAVYNAFIFGYAETHMQEILSGAALLYFLGFGIVCLRVKEGEYPPITGEEGPRRGRMSADIRLFIKESFSVRFYWYLYLTGAFGRVTYALAIFGVFMSKEMGLTVDQMGKLAAVGSIAGILATYFTAVLVDRWHPMRITVYEKIFTCMAGYGGWIWLYVTLPGDLYFWLSMGGTVVYMFNYQLTDAAGIPLLMRILPKSRYGQFSSAAAMIRSFAMIVGGILAGLYMDLLRWFCDGADFAYRLTFTWVWPFNIITTILTVLVYQEWKRYGGDTYYRPPAPWSPDGFEEVVDKVKSAPMRPRAVMLALYLGLAASVLNIGIVLGFMNYMHQHGMVRAIWWYGWVLVPVMAALTAISCWQIVSVKRDIQATESGLVPRFGVPHHGVFLVQAVTALVSFPVNWMQTLWMIKIDYETELILFGVNTLFSGLAGIAALQLIRWIERVQPALPQETPAAAPVTV